MAFVMAPRKTEFRITAEDKIGLFKNISIIISRSHVNIANISSLREEKGGFRVIKVVCDTDDLNKVQKIILKLKSLGEIKEIEYKFV